MCEEYKESLLFRMGELAARLCGCGNNPGENGKLMKQGVGKGPYATGIGRKQQGLCPPLPAPQMPLLCILLSGSFRFWLHTKSPGELLKNIDVLASCQTN